MRKPSKLRELEALVGTIMLIGSGMILMKSFELDNYYLAIPVILLSYLGNCCIDLSMCTEDLASIEVNDEQ